MTDKQHQIIDRLEALAKDYYRRGDVVLARQTEQAIEDSCPTRAYAAKVIAECRK